MQDTKSELSIIIVNWNGKELLKNCFDSIAKYPPSVPSEIIVVDNASTDGSQEWLESDEPREILGDIPLVLIKNEENLGFGRANNIALKYSEAEYFLLLNSDIEVEKDAIDILLSVIKSNNKIGMVGPKILNKDGTLSPSVYHCPPRMLLMIAETLRFYKLFPSGIRGRIFLGPHFERNESIACRFISGCAMLLKKEVFETTGGFDEDFFMYGEDVLFCHSIVSAGWQIYFEPRAKVIHLSGKSSKKRWTNFEKEVFQTTSYIKAISKILTPLKFKLFLLTQKLTLNLEYTLRKLRKMRVEDIEVYFEAMKRYKNQ